MNSGSHVTCLQIAEAAKLSAGRSTSREHLYKCPGHDDQHPSLSINSEKDCFNCPVCNTGGNWWTFAAFIASIDPKDKPAISRWLQDNGLSNGTAATSNSGIAEPYPYVDETEKLVYEVVRLIPKGFRQRRPNGTGGWIWNLNGVRRVLFQLPDVRKASDIFIVEGEKDALALKRIGLTGTTNSQGAGNWTPELTQQLQSHQHVIIIPDNDAPGKKHAAEVAQSIFGHVASVKILELPGLPPKGDVSDWLASSNNDTEAEDLVRLGEQTSRWEPVWPQSNLKSSDSPWATALSAPDFISSDDEDIDWLEYPLLAPGSITEIFSPRGIGKTHVALATAVKLASIGHKVLLVDRDNSQREVRRRLKAWGGLETPNMSVMTRDKVPPLTDAAAWATFPFSEYALVVIDSLDSSTEGVGEKDSSKPSRAIAPLLDIAHRDDGPAILVLGNTIKSGEHSRGSGIVEDRADICFEVRDATGFAPTGKKNWWEELPSAAAGSWGNRASRRKQQDVYRLAFVPSKFRIGEEPNPFVFEINLSEDLWSIRNVTDIIEQTGTDAQNTVALKKAAHIEEAIAALAVNVAHSADLEIPVCRDKDAIPFLMKRGIGRNQARDLIHQNDHKHWYVVTRTSERGQPKVLLPTTPQTSHKSGAAAEIGQSKTLTTTTTCNSVISATPANIERRKCDVLEPASALDHSESGLFPPPRNEQQRWSEKI